MIVYTKIKKLFINDNFSDFFKFKLDINEFFQKKIKFIEESDDRLKLTSDEKTKYFGDIGLSKID